ncbi:MAG: hypothetical protein K2X38_10725 [Gemmataceae bacterium]|nr:hypothetical protein [Gemmataceae bacterium]
MIAELDHTIAKQLHSMGKQTMLPPLPPKPAQARPSPPKPAQAARARKEAA